MHPRTLFSCILICSLLLASQFAGQLRPSAALSWDDHQVSYTKIPQESVIAPSCPSIPSVPERGRVEYGAELPPDYETLSSTIPNYDRVPEEVCGVDEAPIPASFTSYWKVLNNLYARCLHQVRLLLDLEGAWLQLDQARSPIEDLTITSPLVIIDWPLEEAYVDTYGKQEVLLQDNDDVEEEEEEEGEVVAQQDSILIGASWFTVLETTASDGLPACAYPNSSLSLPRVIPEEPALRDSDSWVVIGNYVTTFLSSSLIRRVNNVSLLDLVQLFTLIGGLLFIAFVAIALHVEETKQKIVVAIEQRSKLQHNMVLRIKRVRKISLFVQARLRSLSYRNGKLRRAVKRTKEQLEKSHSYIISLRSSAQQRETTANENILSLCEQYNHVEDKRASEIAEKFREIKALETAKLGVEEQLRTSHDLIIVLYSHISSLKEENKEQRHIIRSYEDEQNLADARRREEERLEEERKDKQKKEEERKQEEEQIECERIEREEKERAREAEERLAAMREDELARRVRQEQEDKRRREEREAEEQRNKEAELRQKALAAMRARQAEAKKIEAEKRMEEEMRAEEKKVEEEEKKAADYGPSKVEKKRSPYSHFNTSKRAKKLAKRAKQLQQSPDTTADPVPPVVAPQQKEKEKQGEKQEKKKRDWRPAELYRPPRTVAAQYPQE